MCRLKDRLPTVENLLTCDQACHLKCVTSTVSWKGEVQELQGHKKEEKFKSLPRRWSSACQPRIKGGWCCCMLVGQPVRCIDTVCCLFNQCHETKFTSLFIPSITLSQRHKPTRGSLVFPCKIRNAVICFLNYFSENLWKLMEISGD